jgi:hypothetical protein
MKSGMSETITQGHYISTPSAKLGKGKFDPVGTFIDEGELMTTKPRGTSVNVKTNGLQNGEGTGF